MRSIWLFPLAIAVLVAVDAPSVEACVCGAFPKLEDVARESPLVVIGRVAAVGDLKYDDDPAWVDIDAVDAIKGEITSTPVRIWNDMAGSSCGGALEDLRPGAVAAFAVTRVSSIPPENREIWTDLDLHPAEHDLLLYGTCGESLRVLQTRREQDRWRARRLK